MSGKLTNFAAPFAASSRHAFNSRRRAARATTTLIAVTGNTLRARKNAIRGMNPTNMPRGMKSRVRPRPVSRLRTLIEIVSAP